MKRRDIFKKLGLAGVGIMTGGLLLASKDAEAQDKPKNKLIVNRQKMRIADPANPTKFELKHSPDISFGEKDPNGFTKVLITVGQAGIIHPTKAEHWIDFMKIFKNGQLVSHMEFENGPIRGYGEHYINIQPQDLIKVEIGCNIHGIWESAKTYQ